MQKSSNGYILAPTPNDPRLTKKLEGVDQHGNRLTTSVVTEKPLTVFLNGQEIVTLMTIGDEPELLAVGFLLNQNMLRLGDKISGIEYEDDLDVVVVRTDRETDFEKVLKKKTITSGCAQGTVFGDLMDKLSSISLSSSDRLRTSWLYELSKKINNTPSLYLEAGAIHGCVLCKQNHPLIYMEDVGRHNAIDKIAGYMFLNNIEPIDKLSLIHI